MWRGAIIVAVVALLSWAQLAQAYNTNTFVCSGGGTGLPVNIVWSQTACAAGGTGGRPMPPGVTNSLFCPGSVSSMVFSAQWPSGAILPCTQNVLDTSTVAGTGVFFLNSLLSAHLTSAEGSNNLGQVILANNVGSTNGGCSASTVAGVSSWTCPITNVQKCYGGTGQSVYVDCAFSYRREPDVEIIQNYIAMSALAVAFLAGLGFGWRLGHGRIDQ